MRYLLVVLVFTSSSFAYEFYAKLEPINSFMVKSSVNGKVIYTNEKIEGYKAQKSKIVEIDSYVDRIDLQQSNNKLKAINFRKINFFLWFRKKWRLITISRIR